MQNSVQQQIVNLPDEPVNISSLEGDHEVDGIVVSDSDGLDVGAPADLLVVSDCDVCGLFR